MLELVIAPDPIYRTICTPVGAVDARVRGLLDGMMQTLQYFEALGIGAPMVGLTERLVVIALEDEAGKMHHYKMVNPVITECSTTTVTTEEASITFLGVSAPVTRSAAVTVEYLDENAVQQTVRLSGIVAVCVQHEIDYLDGKTILDHVSATKRDMMKRKMEKQKKFGPVPHVHGAHCSH